MKHSIVNRLLAVVIAGSLFQSYASFAGVRAEGKLVVRYFKEDGDPYVNPNGSSGWDGRFIVVVDHPRVIIRTVDPADKRNEYWEFRTDGATSLLLEKIHDDYVISNRFDHKSNTTVPLKRVTKPANRGNVNIRPSTAPTMVGALTPVWLAFAAESVLLTNSVGASWPFRDTFLIALPRDYERMRERAFWETSSDTRKGISSFAFLRDDGNLKRFKAYRGETTNAIFHVSDWLSFNGQKYPKRFSLSCYPPTTSPTARFPTWLSASIEGETIQIKQEDPLAPESVIPTKLPYSITVADERVEDFYGEPLTYLRTNGNILSLDQASEALTRRAVTTKQAPPKRLRSVAITVASVGTILFTLVVIAWAKSGKLNQQTKKE